MTTSDRMKIVKLYTALTTAKAAALKAETAGNCFVQDDIAKITTQLDAALASPLFQGGLTS